MLNKILCVHIWTINYLKGLEAEVVVAEIAVVDDGGIEFLSVGHNDVVDLLRDQWSRLSSLRMDVLVKLLQGFAGV